MLKKAAIALFLVIAALCGAQAKLDPFDAHCANILVLQSKPVQKELGITEGARAQLNVHAAWHQKELMTIDQEIKSGKVKSDDPALKSRVEAVYNLLKAKVLGVLTPKQVTRLREISLQNVGDAALCDPVVAKRIGMSNAQTKKMQNAYKEGARKFAELESSEANAILAPYKDRKPKDEAEAKRLNAEIAAKMKQAADKAKPKLDAIRATYSKKMKGILTSKQMAAYKALLGKPFAEK